MSAMIFSVRSGFFAASPMCGSLRAATGIGTRVREGWWSGRRSRALPDPEADEGQAAHADEQGDEALGHRADATERGARRGSSGAAAGR